LGIEERFMAVGGYVLRQFDNSHITGAAWTFADIFTYPPWNYDWLSADKAARYFTDLLATPGFTGFAYVKAGDPEPVGFCLGLINDYFAAAIYEIKEIFVRRGLQGGGLGGAMLGAVEERLASIGVYTVTLFTKNDIPAYDFYIKNGYAASSNTVFFSKQV